LREHHRLAAQRPLQAPANLLPLAGALFVHIDLIGPVQHLLRLRQALQIDQGVGATDDNGRILRKPLLGLKIDLHSVLVPTGDAQRMCQVRRAVGVVRKQAHGGPIDRLAEVGVAVPDQGMRQLAVAVDVLGEASARVPIDRPGAVPVSVRLEGTGEQRPGMGILRAPPGGLVRQIPGPGGIGLKQPVAREAERPYEGVAVPARTAILAMTIEQCRQLRA
jgi:hypothetical protein